jgi:iron complex transport system substrate-binding protein
MFDLEGSASAVVDSAIAVHRKAGPGMLESAYESMLEYELLKRGHRTERQKCVDVRYDELVVERALRIDLIVDDAIIVEIKSAEKIIPVNIRQMITYLRMTNRRLGLILNFGQNTLKEGGIKRVIDGYD